MELRGYASETGRVRRGNGQEKWEMGEKREKREGEKGWGERGEG